MSVQECSVGVDERGSDIGRQCGQRARIGGKANGHHRFAAVHGVACETQRGAEFVRGHGWWLRAPSVRRGARPCAERTRAFADRKERHWAICYAHQFGGKHRKRHWMRSVPLKESAQGGRRVHHQGVARNAHDASSIARCQAVGAGRTGGCHGDGAARNKAFAEVPGC